ncbi:galactokinase [Novosphingobium aquiterrae]|uniref:Galactokinase n=1 Tax=Novosphingobium aquiterrae TaxID=624388 RepID=A0ABV6PKT9_9SPHN
MKALQDRVRAGFEQAFGQAPSMFAAAPGRVNLIGEHTDYNDGWVLPMAIGVGTIVAARPRSDGMVNIAALDLAQTASFAIATPIAHAPPGDWSNYPRGVAAALIAQGIALGGADLAVTGAVPQGAGLSSSASLEVATGLALAALAGHPGHDRTALALAGQRAEHDYAGCNCGIMDQLVSARAEAGHAVLIDCRSLACRAVPMPQDCAVLIVHSGISRGLVDGEYNTRRSQCEIAARHFSDAALRDVDLERLEADRGALDDTVFRRARHVVTENARTLAAAEALQRDDLATLGDLMAASHASMRDDFAITTPEIDALAAKMGAALQGRGGARMTGGGFGGAVIAVGRQSAIAELARQVSRDYRTPRGEPPQTMIEVPAAGAHLIDA